MTIRILKVGGSLFDLPNLGVRLRRLLLDLSPAKNVLLAGGGEATGLIAKAQALHRLSDEQTHWLCIQALSLTAAWLSALLPEATLTDQASEIPAAGAPSLWILDAQRLLKSSRACETIKNLPRDWSVTTDSISAAVAVELGAAELILLKSVDSPQVGQEQWLAAAARLGVVDPHFPLAAASIPKIGWINLRRPGEHQ